jgi:hypothetical protein
MSGIKGCTLLLREWVIFPSQWFKVGKSVEILFDAVFHP